MSEHTPWRLQTRHHGASGINEVIIQEGKREVLRVGGDDWEISDFLLIVRAANSHEELLNLREIAIDIEACLRSGAPVPDFMQFAFSDAITATQEAKAERGES